MTIKCTYCKEDKPLSEYAPSAPNWPDRQHWCRPCNRTRVQIARHGLTTEQRVIIATAQGGCRICGHPEPSAKGWVVDHDHECCAGEVSCPKCRRGVICQWCNMVLGNAFDRPQLLRAAAAYLDATRTCDWHKPVACATRLCGNSESASSTYVEDVRRRLTEKVVQNEIDGHLSNARTNSDDLHLFGAYEAERYAPADGVVAAILLQSHTADAPGDWS